MTIPHKPGDGIHGRVSRTWWVRPLVFLFPGRPRVDAAVMMFVVAGLELMTTQRFQTAGGFTPLRAGVLVATVAVPSISAALLGGLFESGGVIEDRDLIRVRVP